MTKSGNHYTLYGAGKTGMSKVSAEKKAQYAATRKEKYNSCPEYRELRKEVASSEQLIAFANWVNNNVKV